MDLGTAFDNCYRLVSDVDNIQPEDNGQHPYKEVDDADGKY